MKFDDIETTNDILTFLNENIEDPNLRDPIENLAKQLIAKTIIFSSENPTSFNDLSIRAAVINLSSETEKLEYVGYSFVFYRGEEKEGFFLVIEDDKITKYVLLDDESIEDFIKPN